MSEETPTGCLLPADPAALDAELDRRVERGELTTDDADTVRMFAEWLANSGPPSIPGQPARKLTPQQRAFRLDTFRDPAWRTFLGITEAEARAAVENAGEPWDPPTSPPTPHEEPAP